MRDSRFRRQRFNANGLAERIAILLVVAVVVGISIGLLMPKVNPTVGEMTGEYVATGSAAETLPDPCRRRDTVIGSPTFSSRGRTSMANSNWPTAPA